MEHSVNTPWHLWVVGGLGAVWNGLGCIDYAITMRIGDDEYVAQFVTDAEKLAFFTNMPLWAEASWALGVGGGLAGSLLLLSRSRHAFAAFLFSLVGLVGCTMYEYVLSSPQSLEIFREAWKVAVVTTLWLVAVFLALYANRMRQTGVLK